VASSETSAIGVYCRCWCVADVPPPPGRAASAGRGDSRASRSSLPLIGSAMRRNADRTVLIVEPDADARAQLRATLEGDGYTVIATSGGDDALSIIDQSRIKLVVTELYLGNRKSRCLLNAICTPPPARRAKVLAYTRHGRARDRAWAARAGAAQRVGARRRAPRLAPGRGQAPRRARPRRARRGPAGRARDALPTHTGADGRGHGVDGGRRRALGRAAGPAGGARPPGLTARRRDAAGPGSYPPASACATP